MINRKPISILVTARDISSRLEAEKKSQEAKERIQMINAELEEKVKERTLMLQQANQELESFSYSVSHDLRAPLRHIDAFSKLLQKSLKEGKEEKSGEYLTSILDSVKKMKDLIDSLLMLSRTGRAQLQRETFDMKLLVDQLIKETAMEDQHKEIDWNVAELGEAHADVRLMKQVWYNLVSNAIKFSNGKDRVYIEIGCEQIDNKKVWYIKDKGVGFDARYMDKLFGVFQRLHSEEEFEGTGIGLATVKRIIDKHQGMIWAESELNKGSVFYFHL